MSNDKPLTLYLVSERRLLELLNNERLLFELEGAGVDNWDGYEDAMDGVFDDEIKEVPEFKDYYTTILKGVK